MGIRRSGAFPEKGFDSTRGKELSDPNRKLVGGNGRGTLLIGSSVSMVYNIYNERAVGLLVNSLFGFCVLVPSIEAKKEYGTDERRRGK